MATVEAIALIVFLGLLGFIGFVILICVILYLIQDRLLYMTIVPFESRYPHNNAVDFQNPGSQGLRYQDLRITTPDGTKLHGWLIKASEPEKSRTVIFYHQNAENIGYRVKFFREYIMNTESNIVIFGYRGYSYSEGKPSEKGIKQDGLAILYYVTNRLPGIDRSRVFIHGKSLGGGVTIYTASNAAPTQIKGAIIQNTFTSISDVIQSIMKRFCLGPFAFLRNYILTCKWRSIDIVDRILVPTLFIKSKKDRLIPTTQMDQLQQKLEASGGNCRQFAIPNGNHVDTWVKDKNGYFQAINDFFRFCERRV